MKRSKESKPSKTTPPPEPRPDALTASVVEPISHLDELRLTIELVPRSAWGENLRTRITRRRWEKIREAVIESQHDVCGICGADEGRLNCHEIWQYDDIQHRMSLIGFIALCDVCHSIKHFGRTMELVKKNILKLDPILNHFCRVNGCSYQIFREHRAWAKALYRERSQHEWTLDLGDYNSLVRAPTDSDSLPRTSPRRLDPRKDPDAR